MTRSDDRVILLALWMLNFTTSIQFLIVAPILPQIGEQLHVPEEGLGVLVAAYAVTFGVFALIAGPVSDWLGRRTILRVGAAGMTVALGLHGLSNSFATLMLARAFAGAWSGVLSGATIAYIGDYFPYARRGWANGWIGSSMAAGQILGIPAGTLLADADFRTPFVAFGLVGAAATLLILRYVPQPDVERSAELTLRSAIHAYTDLLAQKVGRNSVTAYVLMFFGVGLFVTHLPTWLERRFDATGLQIATVFAVGGSSNLIVAPLAGSLSDRVGRKVLVVFGSVATAAVMGLMPWVTYRFEVSYVLFFLVMIFVALRISPQQSLVSSLVSAKRRGSLMSLCLATGQMLGFGLGASLSGVLYAYDPTFTANGALSGLAATLMAAVVWFGLPEPTGEEG